VVEVTKPILVSVNNTDGTPKEGLKVYAFDGEIYTGVSGTTDASGDVSFTLPEGEYRFRADLNGTHFWSDAANHCILPGCETAAVTVTVPVTVTVAGENGDPYPDLDVYAFDGETYTGFHGVTDESGEVVFTLPEGDYRFRTDYDGVQFWSNTENHCTLPGCTEAGVAIPGGLGHEEVTIDYSYDPLNRLTAADYSNSEYFHYQYDAVGNRLQMDSSQDGVVTYQYDAANRLIEAGGVSYTWDNNGSLLSDGTSTYTYNYANRLAGVTQDGVSYSYAYNGMGDRLQQSVDGVTTNYTLDLNAGLTQVLADGTHSYLYGQGRIVQEETAVEYFLGDAMNSVRQLVDGSSAVTLTQNYEPYGSVLSSTGEGESIFNFTGEIKDGTGLVHLRARYYKVDTGRFTQKDPSRLERNLYLYGRGNPVNRIDPAGLFSKELIASSMGHDTSTFEVVMQTFAQRVPIAPVPRDMNKWGFFEALLDAKDGDTLRIGRLLLLTSRPRVQWGEPKVLRKIGCDKILVGNDLFLDDFFYHKLIMPTWRELPVEFWRDTSASYYILNTGNSTQRYVDGSVKTDLPDFHGMNVGGNIYGPLGASLSIVSDRFGNMYLVLPEVNVGLGISDLIKLVGSQMNIEGGISYFEGYVSSGGGLPIQILRENEASEGSIQNVLTGVCGSTGVQSDLGMTMLRCVGGGKAKIISIGVAFGINIGTDLRVEKIHESSSMGWDWALKDVFSGTTYPDLMLKAKTR
jgi:RHS repeat-associated protein